MTFPVPIVVKLSSFVRTQPLLPSLLGLVALFCQACASAGPVSDTTAPDDTADLEALYWARLDSARASYVDADVHFMTGMISHHAQALIMADLAPANGASSAILTLAARITNAQMDEIATMQNWLRARGEAVPEVHISGLDLMIHGAEGHDMHMPGMLSDEQLQELAAARGAEFDRLFLAYMIQHHRGAVTMVDHLFAQDGAGQDEAAFKLASDIHVDQLTEIARMEGMLKSVTGTGRRP